MNISAPFIQRPIATALIMVGLLVGGLVAYPLMPVASLPNVNYPTVTVTAQLPGADPQTIVDSAADHRPAKRGLFRRVSPSKRSVAEKRLSRRCADATAACDRLRNPVQLGRPHFALPAPDGVECVETLIVSWMEVRELVSCTSGRSSRRLTRCGRLSWLTSTVEG